MDGKRHAMMIGVDGGASVETPARIATIESTRFLFVGDGLYCGDGGAELQRVWTIHPWKALRGCDGRFSQRGKKLTALSLHELCERCCVRAVMPAVHCCTSKHGDAVWCVRFCGGGGLLTYSKPDGLTHVHTLNTESGLVRKLLALDGGTSTPQELVVKAIISPPAALLFGSLCALLGWVGEPERTKVAPSLTVAFRFAVASGTVRRSKDDALR